MKETNCDFSRYAVLSSVIPLVLAQGFCSALCNEGREYVFFVTARVHTNVKQQEKLHFYTSISEFKRPFIDQKISLHGA